MLHSKLVLAELYLQYFSAAKSKSSLITAPTLSGYSLKRWTKSVAMSVHHFQLAIKTCIVGKIADTLKWEEVCPCLEALLLGQM